MKLLNAFSLQMVSFPCTIEVEEIGKPQNLGELESCVGHADTARLLGVAMNRVNSKLAKGEEAVVAQFTGGRLPEGATSLPEGCVLKFYKVRVL